MLPLLLEAARIAIPTDPYDKRAFILGAVGVRKDGVMVSAKNGAVISSTFDDYRIIGDAHAECRVIRKLGKGGTIYVARVLKKDGTLAMARPCGSCRLRCAAAGVRKVYYSIDTDHYGVYHVHDSTDRIYEVNSEQASIRFRDSQTATRLYLLGTA
jgi:tRNA(Arg) A34 adenosine deaminase TadA